jgi:hypothetical protein
MKISMIMFFKSKRYFSYNYSNFSWFSVEFFFVVKKYAQQNDGNGIIISSFDELKEKKRKNNTFFSKPIRMVF